MSGTRQAVVLTLCGVLAICLLCNPSARAGSGAADANQPAGEDSTNIRLFDAEALSQWPVSSVTMQFTDADGNDVDNPYLKQAVLEDWSPAKVGQPVNEREVQHMIRLLNLNPDRYISAAINVSSTEPNTRTVDYRVVERNPWHPFIQIDNSGTRNRRWAPRVGIINTNLLGYDDKFTVVYQAKPEKGIDDNYSIYGDYDIPILTPRLRLKVAASHSEYDISTGGPLSFLGSGTSVLGTLRYNVLEHDRWFFDVTGSLGSVQSNITPSLFPQFLASSLRIGLWGTGLELHRRTDMSRTTLSANLTESLGGSDRQSFNLARPNADPDFTIYTFGAGHSRFLDANKVQHLRGLLRWIRTEDRLVPATMTSFGGMYSVRGYEEHDTIADGGLLFQVQYEYDLIAANATSETDPDAKGDDVIRKLAPLAFFDYGRSRNVSPLATEKRYEELMSVGFGGIVEIGKHFSGAIYCGFPITETVNTGRGKGTVNVSFMLRN